MKAVFDTGGGLDWLPAAAGVPWPLLPVGNRPLLEVWAEFALELGARELWLLLGDGAYEIEHYAGDGARWGLPVRYSFLRPGHDATEFLLRKRGEWSDGLLFLGGPLFPRRSEKEKVRFPNVGTWCRWEEDGRLQGLLCAGGEVESLLTSPPSAGGYAPTDLGFRPFPLRRAADYYQLNMDLVNGEIERYVTPGYNLTEGSYIGYNVQIPPACELRPPVMIGNHVRLRPLCEIGPAAVIGNHVVVDQQSSIRHSVVLDGTYVGRNLELEGRIVCGGMLIDPESGTAVHLEDPLLLDRQRRPWRGLDALQTLAGKVVALGLWLLLLPAFALLYPCVRLRGRGHFRQRQVADRHARALNLPVFQTGAPGACLTLFRALSLDRWPALGLVVLDRLHLCGHEPIPLTEIEEGREGEEWVPLPAAFSEELLLIRPGAAERAIARHWARHQRGPLRDLRRLGQVLAGRLSSLLSPADWAEDHA